MTVLTFTNLSFLLTEGGDYMLLGDMMITSDILITHARTLLDGSVIFDVAIDPPLFGGPANNLGVEVSSFSSSLITSNLLGHRVTHEFTYVVQSTGLTEIVQVNATLFTEEEKKNLLILGGAVAGVAIIAYLMKKR